MSSDTALVSRLSQRVQDLLRFGHGRRYEVVASQDEAEHQASFLPKSHESRSFSRWCIAALILSAASIAILAARNDLFGLSPDVTTESTESIDQHYDEVVEPISGCPKRHEWRTLTRTEQQAYIDAVLCLQHQPSVLSSSQKSYDDFPWIHSHVGYYTHNSAPFLPWHRYFLHIYEESLRQKCGYKGSLTYWDWTLDSEALEHSPVFDAQTGFGGDGEVDAAITVGRSGRCVVDGPFAGTNVSFYDVKFNPHCLSRGFRDQEGKLGHIDGHEISSASIEEVLSLNKYEDFVALMESRVHDAIPFGIGGDFETFTAPYDPIFFLHHTQLDRLWWLWQTANNGSRKDQYGGHKQRHSIEMASLEDSIDMHGLAPSIKVSEVMDTSNELLCYTY